MGQNGWVSEHKLPTRRSSNNIFHISSIIIILSILIISSFSAIDASSIEDTTRSTNDSDNNVKTRAPSLSGEVDIYDAVDSVILGKDLDGVGHRMGIYADVDDYNGDGLNDIALASHEDYSASGVPDDGRIYIFFGDGKELPDIMDLDIEEADHIIMGDAFFLKGEMQFIDADMRVDIGSQLECGDYNNDGYQDLIISVSFDPSGVLLKANIRFSVLIYGEEEGWPREIVINLSDYHVPDYKYKKLWGGMTALEQIPILELEGNNHPVRGGFGHMRDITNDHMITADIDKDGYDDLISGGFLTDINGTEPRVWTWSIFWGDTENRTMLYEEQDYSYMSKTFDIGDIDGDGWMDAVIGAPMMTKEFRTLDNYGAAFLLFNLSRLKEGDYEQHEILLPMNETYDTMIWGSGKYDWMGNNIRLHDINGDRMDEIFIGAPYADGPGDLNINSGQIYMFKGRPMNGFPKIMDADNDADSIVFGDQGYVSGNPVIMGDSLGNRFEITDLDANGELEFIAALPTKNLPVKDYRQRNKAGLVMVYRLKDLFNDENGIVQISNSNGIFVLHGYDSEDNLGYQMLLKDVDTDGIEDLFLTSPMADGENNTRPRCGEAYFIRGKGLVINDLILDGSTVDGRNVYLGNGKMEFGINYRNTKGSSIIKNGKMVIDPGRMDLEIEFDRNGYQTNDHMENALLDNYIDIEWFDSDEQGSVKINISPGWDLVSSKFLDVHVEFLSGDNETITRTYSRAVIFRRDVKISNQPGIYHNGIEMIKPGRWFNTGEQLGIDKPILVYKKDPKRQVMGSPFLFRMYNGDELLDEIEYIEAGKMYTEIEDIPMYSISIHAEAPGYGVKDWKYGSPDTGSPYRFDIYVDRQDPVPAKNMEIGSAAVSPVENFSMDGRFKIEWEDSIGIKGDNNESGVKYYEVNYLGNTEIPMEYGGLHATYYLDNHFLNPGLERIEPSLDFLNWGLWGPEPSIILPDHFSARYYGSIFIGAEYEQKIRLSGVGDVKVFIDDSLVLDWFDLRGTPEIGSFQTGDPKILPVEIYYRHETGRSGIKMEYLHPSGSYELMDDDKLLHPANSTELDAGTSGSLDAEITSVDWTGKRSHTSSITGLVDSRGPQFDFIDTSTWYGANDISIRVSVDDGDPSISTGVKPESIQYRTREENEEWSQWTCDGLWFHDRGSVSEKGSFLVDLTPVLIKNWKGVIQLRAEDVIGNPSTSDILWFGIDTHKPTIDLLEPKQGCNINANVVEIRIDTKDIGGSGIDPASIMCSFRIDEGDPTDWYEMDLKEETGEISASYVLMDVEGTIKMRFKSTDNVGNEMITDEYIFNISRIKKDLPPVPIITGPEDGEEFEYGSLITFSAEGTTDDKGMGGLLFTWFSSIDGIIGTGMETTAILTDGRHMITLYVDDGNPGNNVSITVNISVKEKEKLTEDPPKENKGEEKEGPGIFLIMIPLLIIAFIAIIVAVVLKKRHAFSDDDEEVELPVDSEEN